MIDIMIHPEQLAEAKRDIKDIIRTHNRYNQFSMIELRDCYGRFMPEHYWLYVIDNTDSTPGEYFIRIEFEDDYKIQNSIVEHFGGFNVGCL